MYSDSAMSKAQLDKLPQVKGHKVMLAVAQLEEKTKGGIILPQDTKDREELASILGYVVRLGSDCYKEEDKFPGGPYCQEGDWVLFRSYSGIRFKIDETDFRIVDDDSILAVVEDPRGIERA